MPTKKKPKNVKGANSLNKISTSRSRLYSVVIAGGSGARFWPLSRQETPKQLLTIGSHKQTLIQSTISRINPLISFERTYIVTNPGQAEPINLQLLSMTGSSWNKQLIIEPEAKNTAPAIGLAAIYLKQIDPDAIIVVLSSDHIIKKSKNFHSAVIKAAKIS
ncbi:MAG: sugar phosphate nucleotidyltransferase, partial [Nitrospirota bacterium]